MVKALSHTMHTNHGTSNNEVDTHRYYCMLWLETNKTCQLETGFNGSIVKLPLENTIGKYVYLKSFILTINVVIGQDVYKTSKSTFRKCVWRTIQILVRDKGHRTKKIKRRSNSGIKGR